jgi:membrane associated rhomboid family serine protease
MAQYSPLRGGGGGFGGFSFFPPVIRALLLLNGFIFLAESLILDLLSFNGMSLGMQFSRLFALQPIDSGLFWPWQLITYQFMHAGFSHIFFNLLALWMFGAELENLWGGRRFLIFYLLSGIGGGLVHLGMQFLPGMEGAPTVGASGAIMGVLLAFGFTFPDRPVMMFPIFFPIPARIFVLLYAAMDLISGLMSTNSGIAHFAHLGGAFMGYMLLKHGDDIGIFRAADKIFTLFRPQKEIPPIRDSYSAAHMRVHVPGNSEKTEQPQKATGLYFDGREITTEEIDSILDKISLHGFNSLTEKEKRILYEVSKNME